MMQVETVSARAGQTTGPRLDLDAVPGPAPMRFLGSRGNVAHAALDPIGYGDLLVNGGYGPVVSFVRGMDRGMLRPGTAPGTVLVFTPALNQQVLSRYAIFPETAVFRLPPDVGGCARLTSGLLFMEGDKHRRHRRMITPLFHQKQIERYRDMFVAATGRALDRWKRGSSIEMLNESGRILHDFQNKSVLGLDEPLDGKSLGERVTDFYDRLADPVTMIPIHLPFTPRRKMIDRGNRLTDDLGALIAQKRAAKEGADDVLTMMIQACDEDGAAMTEDELIGEVAHHYEAGWVSTRSAIAWITYMIAQHPKIAADLHDELTSTLRGDAPTVEQLRQLPLLEGVIKESLRLFPPIYMTNRSSIEPVELGDYRLPAQTEVLVSIYHTHRLPDLYTEPRRFRPERWRSIDPGTYGYIPFSVGPRTCPGMALAMMQMKIMMAMIVQRVRLELPRGARIDRTGVGTLVPKQGMWMRVRAQDRRFAESRAKIRGSVASMVDLEA
jgi:cytochrome P450